MQPFGEPTANGSRVPEVALVNALLRSEALAALVLGVAVWVGNGGSLAWFAVLILAPDLSMIGYAVGSRVGAVTYNVVHNWALAGAAAGVGWWLDSRWLLLAGALLLAHVGMDRVLGYGLKLPSDFRDTHLGRIGRGNA
jgi:Domain of unknown function (DUF4260)